MALSGLVSGLEWLVFCKWVDTPHCVDRRGGTREEGRGSMG